MGCDIHVHTEVKIKGVWHHYSVANVKRNYRLFGKMAGVRSDETDPIIPQRGTPCDATELTLFDRNVRWGDDGHSHSWFGAEEIKQLAEWVKQEFDRPDFWEGDNFGYVFGNNWSAFLKYPEDNIEGLEDIRWIFWFDN